MPGLLRFSFFGLLMVLLNQAVIAQTLFAPGEVFVLGYANDMSACGLGAESDEISFVFFKDLAPLTQFYITDNGWETGNPGFWGDAEGTLRIFRTGGVIPAGTVITLQARNTGGPWDYKIISPDANWVISNENTPGGEFNLEAGGDQFYFLQDGVWDNNGGGMDMATYDGYVLFGFNTASTWAANGTTNESSFHPETLPCYHFEAGSPDYFKYTNPLDNAAHFQWQKRILDAGNWTSYADCGSYTTSFPIYINGFSLPIHAQSVGAWCFDCTVCANTINNVIFNLPPGVYDIIYTDGTDTFELLHAGQLSFAEHLILDTTTFTVISITEVNGCPVPGPFSAATYTAPHSNPGTHYEFSICPDYGLVNMPPLLGPHDPGGVWIPPLDPIFGQYYSSFWGPGTYYYVFDYGGGGPGGGCPPDTASITVYMVDTSGITIEFGCDQNGTPTDITDDRTTVTLNFMGTGLGPTYTVTPLYFGVPTGTVTPIQGITGVPTTFTLGPSTATTNNWTLLVADEWGFFCEYKFPVIPPGWCSDPCDHEMTATLSGDDEICPNSCPDDPAIIFIDVEGGNLNVTGGDVSEYSMDFSISAVGYPTWNFTDSEIQFNDQIEICISNVPAPTYDETAGFLILPQFLSGHEIVLTLLNVYDFYECVAAVNDQMFITIYPLPTITTTNLKFCWDVAFDADLTEYDLFISPFLDVSWYDGNPLQGGDELNAASANLHNVVQLWALVSDDHCENSIQVPFVILPLPALDSVPPQQICQGSSIALQSIPLNDLGNSMATYTYHSGLPPDTSNMLDPLFFIPADSTTIYVHATAGMCHDTLPIEIDVQDYPDFTLQATPCDLLLNTYSVYFTSTADSIHASIGTVVNNPSGQDQVNGIPENVNITIELFNSTSLCNDTVSITAPNCNCPAIAQPIAAQPSYVICEGDATPVLTVTVDPGMIANWYDVPSGGVPILLNSLTFQPPGVVSASYYAESVDPLSNCYSIRTEIPFVVNPSADLQALADQVLCETGTINFNTFIPSVLNGVNGTGGWFNLLTNQSVTGSIQPQNGDAWYYLFNSNPGNCPSSDTVAAVVNPNPDIDLYSIICDENTLTFELLFTTDAEDIVVSTGTLGHITGTDSFSLGNIPFDTDIQFNLQNNTTGCTNNFTQQAPDCSCPALLQQTDHEVCSNTGTLDLNTFEGFGVLGNWQLISTPAGVNPATLAGKILNIQNKDAGPYTLRFIRSVILADCVDTAFFEVTLHTSPFADAGIDAVVCAPDQIILTGTAGGSNVTYTWQENGTGSITNPNTLNTNYTPTLADITNGSVNFTLTATDQTGFCPSAQETISVDIDGSAYFILDPATQTYCDTLDLTVDFDDLITFGSSSGEWFFPDTVSAPINGNSQFNPSTLQAGNYTVFYTIPNAGPPCSSDTLGVNLIIENCLCPSVALSVPVDALCSASGTQNLNDFLITAEAGSWSIVGKPAGTKPAVISGTNFITSNSDFGIYDLRFTLLNPVAGCDDFAEISLEVIETPSVQISSSECSDGLQNWEAIIVTSAEDVSNTFGNLTSLGNDRYSIINIPLNTSLQITASNGNGLCSVSIDITAPDCECTLSIGNLPDNVSLCPGETSILSPNVSGGKGAVTQYWIIANDTLFQSSLPVGASGIYHFISIDELGCKEEHFIDVEIYEEMIPDFTTTDITCPGDKDGIIALQGIQGGNSPYFISFNGTPSQQINTFPYLVENLGVGNYNIELTDGFNCSLDFNVMIHSTSSETLNLGPDQTILVGDSVFIAPFLSFQPDSFYWTGDVNHIQSNHLDNWTSPEDDISLQLFAIDDKGCLYTDDITIKVLLKSSIYVPTLFSPNGDGENDLLAPLSDPSITSFEYFEIYSRWGELLFSKTNFLPNEASFGWNGTLRDKPMSPGVFVYRLKAINKKGDIYTQVGDITLVR